MVFAVIFKLEQHTKEQEKVAEAVKKASNGIWCNFWDGFWMIQSNCPNANDIVKCVAPFLTKDDRLFVFEVKNNRQGWLSKDEWDYLNEHVFSEKQKKYEFFGREDDA